MSFLSGGASHGCLFPQHQFSASFHHYPCNMRVISFYYQSCLHFDCFHEISALSGPWGLVFILLPHFLVFLSVVVPLTKEERQFRVQSLRSFCVPVTGLFERLERQPWGSRDAACHSPRFLGGCWWAEGFHLRAKNCQIPCSQDNQKKLLHRAFLPYELQGMQKPLLSFPKLISGCQIYLDWHHLLRVNQRGWGAWFCNLLMTIRHSLSLYQLAGETTLVPGKQETCWNLWVRQSGRCCSCAHGWEEFCDSAPSSGIAFGKMAVAVGGTRPVGMVSVRQAYFIIVLLHLDRSMPKRVLVWSSTWYMYTCKPIKIRHKTALCTPLFSCNPCALFGGIFCSVVVSHLSKKMSSGTTTGSAWTALHETGP